MISNRAEEFIENINSDILEYDNTKLRNEKGAKEMNQIHDCSEIEQSWTLKEELREILEEDLNEKSLFFDGKELFHE